MKMFENTSSTTESLHDYTSEDRKVSNTSMVALLKFVYYERKSIKQAANYLKINYNTAKRIIKRFRHNKIVLDSNDEKCNKLMKDLSPPSLVCPKIVQKPVKPVDQNNFIAGLMKEISQVGNQLISLNQEIKQNQNTLHFLVNYTQTLVNQ